MAPYPYATNDGSATTLTWGGWNETYTVSSGATTTLDTYVNQITWTIWTNATYGSTIAIADTPIWPNWNATYVLRPPGQPSLNAKPSDAEVRAALARDRDMIERAERRAAERKAAEARADLLLAQHLSPEQREDLANKECFYVTSIGKDGTRRRYRIDKGTHGNIKRLDDAGRILETLCVQPSGVPLGDSLLAQKLWLEAGEAELRRVANIRRTV